MKHVIINFHRIDTSDWFERTIQSLRRKYSLVSVAELEEILRKGKQPPRGICHITFDDGDRSFYERAFPVLKQYKVPVSHFVSPAIIRSGENFWFQESVDYDPDKMRELLVKELQIPAEKLEGLHFGNIFKCLPIDRIHDLQEIYRTKTGIPKKERQNMTLTELQETEASGLVTYGAHTLRHPILANETDEVAEQEIVRSVRELEELLGHQIEYFAYPNGYPETDFGAREIGYLKQAGIRLAFSTEPRHLKIPDDPFRLPRMGLSPNNPANALKLILGARWNSIRAVMGAKSPIKEREQILQLLGSA